MCSQQGAICRPDRNYWEKNLHYCLWGDSIISGTLNLVPIAHYLARSSSGGKMYLSQ